MPFAVGALIAFVALARGGYWATGILTLELGAAALLVWVVLEVVLSTSERERSFHRARRRDGVEVEIVSPDDSDAPIVARSRRDYFVIFGFPFRKTHLGVPFVLLAGWIALSLVPLDPGWLSRVSPRAFEMWGGGRAPASLSPFMTARGLWMLLSCFALVAVGAHIGASARRVRQLSFTLFVLGVGFGLHGMSQWLFGLQDLLGRDPSPSVLRASGSFGNRNHYAAFMGMLLLTGLGWVAAKRRDLERATTGRTDLLRRFEESGGQIFLLGLGVVVSCLGLVFSLSRSGIAFALVGGAACVSLVSNGRGRRDSTDRGRASRRPSASFVAFALAGLGLAAWIGLDPVVHRFRLLTDEWQSEQGRSLVWQDTLSALPDFAVTGSGLSTYRYVFPMYRSFGGDIAYAWAHNDYPQVLIELGIPGFSMLLWMMGVVVVRCVRARARLAGSSVRVLHAGYLAALIAIALHSFTDFGLHLAANQALLSVVVGVAVAIEPRARGRRRSSSANLV